MQEHMKSKTSNNYEHAQIWTVTVYIIYQDSINLYIFILIQKYVKYQLIATINIKALRQYKHTV